MATPTLGGLPTDIALANGTDTGTWAIFTTLDAEFKKEGASARSGILRNDLSTGSYTLISGSIDMTGQHVRAWINFLALPYLNFMEFWMTGGGTTAYWNIFNPNTYFGGWKNLVLDCDSTPTSGSYTKTGVTAWGFRFNRTSAPANKINTWVDYIRYGDGYYATGGTSGDEITLSTIFAVDYPAGYGIIDNVEGVYFCYGALTIGNSSTTTWFKMDGQVLVFTDSPVKAGMYKLVGAGSGCRVNIVNSVLRAAGTTDATRYVLNMSDTNLASCTISGSFIIRSGAVAFKTGQTITNNIFSKCLQITQNGVTMTGCVIDNSPTTSSVLSNNPSLIIGCTFNSDGSNHAVEATTAGDYNWNNTLTGYATADGSTGNEAFYNNSGGHINLTVTGGTRPYVRNGSGATTTVIIPEVTLTISAPVSLVGAEIRIYDMDGTLPNLGSELSGTESHSSATYDFTSSASNVVWIQIMKNGYVEFGQQITMPTVNGSFTARLEKETNA